MEFLKIGDDISSYFIVHSHPLIPSPLDVTKTEVVLLFEGQKFHFLENFRAGSQKIVLSNELQKQLIPLLEEGKSVTIRIGGYEETLSHDDFSKQWKNFHAPPYKIPFHLPL